MTSRSRWTVAAALLGIAAATTDIQGQSLAQVAASIEKQRSANATSSEPKPAARVYTNKDLKPSDLPPAVPQVGAAEGNLPDAAPASSGTTVAPSAAAAPEQAQRAEQWWKSRMRELETTLKNDLRAVADMRALHESMQRQPDLKDANGRVYRNQGIARVRTSLTQLESQAENSRRMVEELRDDARRANVPPGWLRWP